MQESRSAALLWAEQEGRMQWVCSTPEVVRGLNSTVTNMPAPAMIDCVSVR